MLQLLGWVTLACAILKLLLAFIPLMLVSCSDTGFCALDHLGDSFSFDDTVYMVGNDIHAMGANITVSAYCDEEVCERSSGRAWFYYLNMERNHIFMNPEYIVNGTFSNLTFLHELGHAVFLKSHSSDKSLYSDGCVVDIMSTFLPTSAKTNVCYESHKESYKAQFNGWVTEYLSECGSKCNGRKTAY